MEKIVELTSNINNWNYEMISLDEVLKTIGINIRSKKSQKDLIISLEQTLKKETKIR